MASTALSGFHFVHRIPVVFRDIDALGHVNNAVYLTYMETARLAFWAQVAGQKHLGDLGVILARAEVDFRSPAYYGDVLDVGVRAAALRRSSIAMEFRIATVAEDRLVTEARKILVCYDYTNRRSMPIPDRLRQLLRDHDPAMTEEV